jgi:TatD DNase family protein
MERLRVPSFDAVAAKLANFGEFGDRLDAVVSIYCDAAALSSLSNWRTDVKCTVVPVYAAFGFHPIQSDFYDERVEQRIVACIDEAGDRCVAWGECGLDYAHASGRSDEQRVGQRAAFAAQIRGAVRAQKPLVVHSRKAARDTHTLLKEHLPRDHPVHLHCFSDDAKQAELLLADFSRLYIGSTGAITYGDRRRHECVARAVPLDRVLFETDAPYMAPRPGPKMSHSGMIPRIAAHYVELRNEPELSLDAVLAQVRQNCKQLYSI